MPRRWMIRLSVVLVAMVVIACGGGVPQDQYAALQAQLEAKEKELQATAGRFQTELEAKEKELRDKAARLQTKESEVAKLEKSVPPPFGVAVETFDSSGPPAYEAKAGTLLAFVQSGMAYDSPADANYVAVVDAATRKVLARQSVDLPKGYQSHGLGVSADARWVYVPSLSSGSKKLHILDGRTLKLAKTLDVGANTHHVDEGTYKQTGKFILVDTGNPEHGQIVLDPTKNNEVIGQIPFGTVLGRPYSGWSSPDGSFAYIAVSSHLAEEKGWISKIDLSTYKETGFFPVGVGPVWVAFSSDGKTAWVSNARSNDVMQIKMGQSKDEKDAVVATVPLGGSPYGMVLTNDGKKLYVVKKTYGATDASTSVYVLDTEAKKIIKEVKVGQQPDHVFLSPNGKEVWVGENRGNQISIIETATDEVVSSIPMPGDTHSVRFVEISTPSAPSAAVPAPGAGAGAAPRPQASPAPSPTSGAANANLVSRGEKLFQETAGCQACHGRDARGGSGPNVRGKTAADIRFQLEENPAMGSLRLTEDEMAAVAAYLQSLPR